MDIWTRASGYINARMRTEKQLRKYLSDKGFDSSEIDAVAEEFKKYGYIDDVNYAMLYFEYAFGKGRGMIRIRKELREKGIDPDIIDEAYDMLETDHDEYETAEAVGRQVLAGIDTEDLDYREKQKLRARIARRLAGRGFPADIVYKVAGRLVP